ncbi:hypothetical protein HUJ05_003241 [Dendroctonus ponderosae]|nr:hypothetical protein HUJ05_003241 [Dendroctonus ponderosae]
MADLQIVQKITGTSLNFSTLREQQWRNGTLFHLPENSDREMVSYTIFSLTFVPHTPKPAVFIYQMEMVCS